MRAVAACLLAASSLLASCAPAAHDGPAGDDLACARFGARPGIEISLLFGLSRPDGRPITDAEWHDFLSRAVTPRFPDGLSVFQASGQWRDRTSLRITSEPSRIVWIAADARAPGLAARLDAVRAQYRRDFQQQSVGLVLRAGCQAF
ncbi:DUF3574 domain-containing protein [Gluconacetobacter sacchari]|uniref:DUF3574 domain-containing protein n=2 Tax=Gluconacetobacter sacchari TaxID=92759 RepID=A0A7W4ICH1_9PROT|nr:DUF3574 domain-containing protein [Gluconacetobacter sacchari]MBB2160222.1 DUF3574 domain-containing protein [Gluconacetobacter sacchari]GBQ28571.1 hypothetical protein AA12717_2992 [Gluconacetobacter sacchari DSM 12717]